MARLNQHKLYEFEVSFSTETDKKREREDHAFVFVFLHAMEQGLKCPVFSSLKLSLIRSGTNGKGSEVHEDRCVDKIYFVWLISGRPSNKSPGYKRTTRLAAVSVKNFSYTWLVSRFDTSRVMTNAGDAMRRESGKLQFFPPGVLVGIVILIFSNSSK